VTKAPNPDRPFVASVAFVARRVGLPALSEGALYGLAGEVVRAIEPHSEADPAALLIQFLAAVGNMIGPGPHCKVEATRHPMILNPVLTGETSKGRKGTSWGHILKLCGEVDEDWARDRVTSGLSSAEGLIAEVRDEDPPKDRRLLVVQGEFAAVLKIMGREGNTLSPTLRDAWDNGNLRTLVKTNPVRATLAHISVIGHITRHELRRYLSDTEAHNGFANRLLWVCAERSKYLPEGGSVPEGVASALVSHLRKVCEWAQQQGKVEIKRDEKARRLWAKEYRRLSDGLPGLLGAATARSEAQVLRLSAIYAVLDCSAVVRVEHLQAALAVWDYCFASAQYIFGEATGDPVADRIREALQGAGAEGMTRTQIRDVLGRHSSLDRITNALAQLAAMGIASSEVVSTEGRPIELWRATEAT
jgi:hypothetical protein